MRKVGRLGIAALAGVAMVAPSVAQSGGAPTQALVAALIVQHYKPNGNTPSSHLDVALIEIGAPHRASAQEGMQLQVQPGQPIYPVHSRYSLVNSSGSLTLIRDWDTHWYAFRSVQLGGRWDLTGNSMRGDVEGNPRR